MESLRKKTGKKFKIGKQNNYQDHKNLSNLQVNVITSPFKIEAKGALNSSSKSGHFPRLPEACACATYTQRYCSEQFL